MKLLLSSYACLPNSGSEPGIGWNWATHLADRGIDVTVLTRAESRPEIEAYQAKHPNPNLKFAYVRVPGKMIRPATGLHYAMWQWRAVKTAREMHRKNPFQLMHHVTYSSIHVPTQLWRLNIPSIFGPIGGGQTTPQSMLRYFGASKRSEVLRTLLTRSLRFSPFHRHWMSKMTVIFAVNRDTFNLVKVMGRPDVRMQFDNGVPKDYLVQEPKIYDAGQRTTRFLWVGRMLPRKALPLALDALSETKGESTLTIVGNGQSREVVDGMIAERGLNGRVHWAGRRLTVEEVRTTYLEHDALLFTSVRETSGLQLIEAMALGLPVICLDLHGASDVVPDNAGFKIPVTTPTEVAKGLATAMDRFAKVSCEEKTAMSVASLRFARNNTWSVRAEQAEKLYLEILAHSNKASNGLQAAV